MSEPTLRLLAVLAHPDDETLGCGGTLARYADEGVETHVLTATRGEAGRHGTEGPHPGAEALARTREEELRTAADVLGVHSVDVLGYPDGGLDGVDPREAVDRIAVHLRKVRPQVILTFAHEGAYGHPDHIAICQFATAATVRAADPTFGDGEPHAVDKVYWMAWDDEAWDLYQQTFKKLTSTVDGVERRANPWPEWMLTSRVDCRPWWRTVWRAVGCHRTQMSVYGALEHLRDEDHEKLWGNQTYYRALSTVNGGRTMETDLFEGVPGRSR